MSAAPENFVLRSTLTSPFGRKVRIAVDVLGLSDRVTLEPADTLDENDTLRLQNPLGKMPCLLLADGTSIYDSGVIIEFLQDVAGTDRLLPARGPERFKTLTLARLADGITDAAILIVYDGRFRPGQPPSERWLDPSARQDRPRARRVRGSAARSGQDRYRLHRARLRARLSRLAQGRGMAASLSAPCRLACCLRRE